MLHAVDESHASGRYLRPLLLTAAFEEERVADALGARSRRGELPQADVVESQLRELAPVIPTGLAAFTPELASCDTLLTEVELVPNLSAYRGRVVIEWSEGYRARVHRAGSKDKALIEIRRSINDPPFSGFLDFCEQLSRLENVPLSWREVLSAVGDVYLLACPTTGKKHVGLANGSTGFWGQWEDYVASGHGGNRRMQELPASDYQVSVLEVAASSTSSDELLKMENRWKEKLLSRRFGLDGN